MKIRKPDRKLSVKQKRRPIDLQVGTEYEYYPNGLFKFNISKLIDHIEANKADYTLDQIDVSSYYQQFCNKEMNTEYVDTADITRPIILAEIAPDRLHHGYPNIAKDYYSRGYNLIDGHHRLAKAKQLGFDKLFAYIVPMEQHIHFMECGFEEYVGYWNGKAY